MILLAQTTVMLAMPVHQLFNYVTNMENYADWFPGVHHIGSKNNLAHGSIGKTYQETLSLPTGEAQLTIEVIQSEANSLFLTQGDLADVLPQMTMKFSVTGDNQCQMQLSFHSRNQDLTQESELILALQQNLSERVVEGMQNLQHKFG